jgi:hypothetical protein
MYGKPAGKNNYVMKESNTYTALDIERYYSGQLSTVERHALEKAALDDPFLADALEGYGFTKTQSTDLASLQQRLQNRIEKERKKRGVFFIGNNWMKIAALLILFAGGGWLVFQTVSTKNEEVAIEEVVINKSSENQTPAIIQKVADSTDLFSDTAINNQLVAIEKEQQTDLPARQNSITVYKSTSNATLPPPPVSTFSQPLKDSFRGEMYAADDMAVVRLEKQVDASSRSNAIAKEKDLSGRVSGADTIKNFDVVLQRSAVALNEVVVLNKKAKTEKPDARQRMQMTVDTLEPAEGWGYFDDYIASNIKSPDKLNSKPISGEVELSFEVNKKGEPINITVTQSLCEKCDEEAVRLLKEGPKWKKKAKKGKVKIRF